jgi:hypothetical protein
MFLQITAVKFHLLSNWLMSCIWSFPSGFPIPFKNCPEAIQEPFGISQRLSYAFLLLPKMFPFPSLSLMGCVSVNIFF